MKITKRLSIAFDIALISLVVYLFLWGRFFPYSPIVLGFEHRDYKKTVLYFHKGTDISVFKDIDRLLPGIENFHQLKYRQKVGVFLCSSPEEEKRLANSQTRFKAFPPYGRIFVSKQAQQESLSGKIHPDVYLTHELSHSLLEQNMSLWQFLFYPKWLMEGLAVYSAGQMGVDGYFTQEQVRQTIRNGYFVYPKDWSSNLWESRAVEKSAVPNKWWFVYSQFGCMVEDLIKKYGKDKFILFMKKELKGGNTDKNFRDIFGRAFESYVNDFKNQ
jgi:hypothetical protein